MSDAVREVLANLRHNARRFLDEGERFDAENQAGAATVSNDVVTVTVDGSGTLLSAEFTGQVTDPERWRHGFGDAYVEALAARRPAHAPDRVEGLRIAPQPIGPLAPEQDEAEARIARIMRTAAADQIPLADLTRTSTVGGVSVTVNGMRVIVDATATRESLSGGVPVDDAVMTAYGQATAEIDALARAMMEGN